MISRNLLALLVGAALILSLADVRQATALDQYFTGNTNTAWFTPTNWNGDSGLNYPDARYDERAIIGYDISSSVYDRTSDYATNPPSDYKVGGVYLGLRQRSTVTNEPLNPDPGPGNLIGRLNINGQTLTAKTTGQSGFGADGRVLVGVEGRGELNITNGTLSALALNVAGEEYTDPNGVLHRSSVSVSGASSVSITGISPQGVVNLERDLRIEGPNVNWNSQSRLTMTADSSFTAAITSPTLHSALKTSNIAVVNGTLNVEFGGAGASGHVPGETWDLVRGNFGIAGGFTNLVGPNKEVVVSGLTTPNPLGTGYRLQKVDGPGESGGGGGLEFQETLQLVYQAYLVLQVDRDSGEMTITNPNGGDIHMDGYTVKSGRGSLLTSYHGINGITPTPPDPNWVFAPNNTVNVLTEIKTPDFTPPIENVSFDLSGGTPVPLGAGFSKTGVAANVENFGLTGEDLIFEYTGPNGDVLQGPVVYTGTAFENNLVLRVNPTTGDAFLKNDSLETLSFDGYAILSSTNSLEHGTWDGIGGSWNKSPIPAEPGSSLTETNPVGSITLDPNDSVAIGDIGAFASQAAQDGLSMQFILSTGLVETTLAGDFDEDGDVDGDDFLSWQRGESPGGALSPTDLADWEANYGMMGGFLPETTFRTGTVVFDSTAGVPAFAAVPEPCAGLLMLIGLGAFVTRRQRGGQSRLSDASAVEIQRQFKQVGARNMSRRFGICVTVLAVLSAGLMVTAPAKAATGGADLINVRLEQPGPEGTKVFAFDPNGTPNDAIPGWTFSGPGVETFGHDDPNADNYQLGDSGTEGGGNPGNEMLLSTLDGIAWQNSSSVFFPAGGIPSTQQYVFSFDAHDIFTIGPIDPNTGNYDGYTNQNRNQLSGRITYGDARNTLTTFSYLPTSSFEHFEIMLPYNDPLITGAVLNQKVGIEFDDTSIEYDLDPNNDPNNQFNVGHAWAGIDNVFLEITGVLPGDLDGDGHVDLNDYFIIRDNQQVAADYLAQGDLVRDGLVDLNDFRAWKLLPAVISSGVLERIAAIPEPASLALVLVMTAFMSGAARQRRFAHFLLLALVVLGGTMSAASKSSAELLLYDPFLVGSDPNAGEYSLGPLAPTNQNSGSTGNQAPHVGPTSFFEPQWKQNQNGTEGNGTLETNNSIIQSSSLAFLGAPSLGGSQTAVPQTIVPTTGDPYQTANMRQGRYLTNPLTAATTGTYYIGYLINYGQGDYSDGIDNNDMGFRTVEFWTDTGLIGADGNLSMTIGYSAYNSSIGAEQNDPRTARMFLRAGGTDVIIEGSPQNFMEDNSTHLIVLKIVLSATNNADRVQLFLDPTDTDEPVIPSAELTNLNFTLGSIGGANLFGGFGSDSEFSNPTLPVFDELRVGTDFIDVLPEFPLKGDCCGAGPQPNGDPDGPDDLVDMTDYNVIFDHLNLTGQPSYNGDVTGDGRVTLADLRLWKDNRTDTEALGASSSANIPEPGGLALALLGTLAFGYVRRVKWNRGEQ